MLVFLSVILLGYFITLLVPLLVGLLIWGFLLVMRGDLVGLAVCVTSVCLGGVGIVVLLRGGGWVATAGV